MTQLPPKPFDGSKPPVAIPGPSPASGSPLLNDWYMCGHDGQPYGPFPFSQLVEFAKNGRVDESTLVLHQIASRNTWISPTRVKGLKPHLRPLPAIPPALPPALPQTLPQARTGPTPTVRPWHRGPRRTGGFSFSRDVITPLISICFLVICYFQFIKKQDVEVAEAPRIKNEPQAYASSQYPRRPNRPPTPAPAPVERPPQYQPTNPAASDMPGPISANAGNLGELLVEKDTEPSARDDKLLEVPLDLTSGRQVITLPELPPNRPLKVSIEGSGLSELSANPNDWIVREQGLLKIYPNGDQTIYFQVKAIVEQGRIVRLLVECQTSLDWLGGDELSAVKLKRKAISLNKDLAKLVANRNAAIAEANNLASMLQSRTLKTLSAAGQAKDRIAQLQSMVVALNSQIVAQESAIARFNVFCSDIDEMLKDAQLSISAVD